MWVLAKNTQLGLAINKSGAITKISRCSIIAAISKIALLNSDNTANRAISRKAMATVTYTSSENDSSSALTMANTNRPRLSSSNSCATSPRKATSTFCTLLRQGARVSTTHPCATAENPASWALTNPARNGSANATNANNCKIFNPAPLPALVQHLFAIAKKCKHMGNIL